jgi:hypothetical protein
MNEERTVTQHRFDVAIVLDTTIPNILYLKCINTPQKMESFSYQTHLTCGI